MLRSLGTEDVGCRAGEPGENVVAVEDVVVRQGGHVGLGAVDVDGVGAGEDDPYEAYAIAEPHEGFIVYFAAAVAGRCDFHDQVGNDFGLAGDPLVQRDLLGGEVGDVGLAHRVWVVFEPDAGVGCREGAWSSGLDEAS